MAKVLIAEDDSVTQQLLCRTLRRFGYEVEAASDGVEALMRIEAFEPDVVLIDYAMPEMDGLALLRRLKRHPEYRLLPTIMLTGKISGSQRQEAIDGGVDAFLRKPVSFQELTHEIQRLVSAGAARA